MATFYVGQRVRIVGAVLLPQFVGKEAVIASPLMAAKHRPTGREWCGHRLNVTGVGTHFAGARLCFAPDQLEPIQPEGHKTVEWNACLWRPEHLREVA